MPDRRQCGGPHPTPGRQGRQAPPQWSGFPPPKWYSFPPPLTGMARRMAQNGAPTHEIERQGRWKQGGGMVGRYTRGGMVGRYTRGETAGSALRYL